MEKTTIQGRPIRVYLRLVNRRTKCFYLVNGSVGIFLPTNETNSSKLCTIQENELFGEMGVIENELKNGFCQMFEVESDNYFCY